MKSKTLLILLASLALSLSGCRKRVVFVEPGTVVKAGEKVKMKLWVPDDKGELILGTGEVPEGAAIVVPLKK